MPVSLSAVPPVLYAPPGLSSDISRSNSPPALLGIRNRRPCRGFNGPIPRRGNHPSKDELAVTPELWNTPQSPIDKLARRPLPYTSSYQRIRPDAVRASDRSSPANSSAACSHAGTQTTASETPSCWPPSCSAAPTGHRYDHHSARNRPQVRPALSSLVAPGRTIRHPPTATRPRRDQPPNGLVGALRHAHAPPTKELMGRQRSATRPRPRPPPSASAIPSLSWSPPSAPQPPPRLPPPTSAWSTRGLCRQPTTFTRSHPSPSPTKSPRTPARSLSVATPPASTTSGRRSAA